MNIYFKPTWLYVKRHKITGLQYFGKTVKSNPYSYFGSGTYWTSHINKHGKEYVETVWVQLFEDKLELMSFAETFSSMFEIVKSPKWANLCPENGTDGGYRPNNYFKIFNKEKKSEKIRQSISNSLKGTANRSQPILVNNLNFASMKKASIYFNVTEQTIYNWIKNGKAIKL